MISAAKSQRAPWARLLLTTTILGVATPAIAQEASSGGAFDEIIVTAQKREESLQNVAASVQAITTERLEQLNVTSFTDYAKFLPNVSFAATYGPGFNRSFIRGVAGGENGNHSGSQPSVGTYLDEQPITTINGALDLHVYDIARVEVLSGPQGTLYGASSQAGTIRIITNKPSTSGFEGGFDSEVNAVDNGGTGGLLEGFANIPVSNNAAIRIVGWAEHEAGYVDNVPGTRTYPTSGVIDDNADRAKDDYNTADTYGARAALRIDLNDSWTVTPSVMGQSQETEGLFAFDPQVGDLQVVHFLPESNKDRWVQAALTVEGRVSNLDVVFTTAYLDRDVEGRQDYADYGYFYDVLAGYGAYFYDNDGNFINPAQWVFDEHGYTKQTNELRISSPAEGAVRFIGGLYYQRQVDDIYQRYIVTDFFDDFEVSTLDDTVWLTSQQRVDVDQAIFGEVSFDLSDNFTVTGGLRVFRAETSLEGFFGFGENFSSSQGEAICFAPPTTRDAPCTDLDRDVEESGTTHRVNLEYRIDDDKMIYGTWSTGYRPPGVNRRDVNPPIPTYDADFLTNYEFGWKTTWADVLRWNGAVFFQEWQDFQYAFIAANSNGLTLIQNAGNAAINGVESDFTWLVSDHLTLAGAVTFLDAKTTEETDFALDGTQLPISPDVKANLTARYEFNWGAWDAYLQAAGVYQGEATVDLRTKSDNPAGHAPEAEIMGTLDSFALLDLSAGLERDGLRISAFVGNVFDERGVVGRYAECSVATCGGQPYDVPSQPRTVGVRLGRSF